MHHVRKKSIVRATTMHHGKDDYAKISLVLEEHPTYFKPQLFGSFARKKNKPAHYRYTLYIKAYPIFMEDDPEFSKMTLAERLVFVKPIVAKSDTKGLVMFSEIAEHLKAVVDVILNEDEEQGQMEIIDCYVVVRPYCKVS